MSSIQNYSDVQQAFDPWYLHVCPNQTRLCIRYRQTSIVHFSPRHLYSQYPRCTSHTSINVALFFYSRRQMSFKHMTSGGYWWFSINGALVVCTFLIRHHCHFVHHHLNIFLCPLSFNPNTFMSCELVTHGMYSISYGFKHIELSDCPLLPWYYNRGEYSSISFEDRFCT